MKKTIGFAWAAAAVAAVSLGGCTSTTRLASSGAVDDLYTTHDRRAIAEAETRREEALARLRKEQAEAWDAVVKEYVDQAGEDGSYSENILSLSYEDSYERRLRGFESLSYKMPGSYYDYYYGDKYFETQTYDPAFYNVIVMGDRVWVEPRYITSMFGHWGTPVNINIGWGWNRWYRPYWGWSYGHSWAWGYDPYWAWGGYYGGYYGWGGFYGWGYDPYYWHNPGYWGWGGHHGGVWGGGWGSGRAASLSSSNRRGSTPGSYVGSAGGRYNSGAGTGVSSSSGSYRRGSVGGVNYQPGLGTGSGSLSGASSSGSYRRGSSAGSSVSSATIAPSLPSGAGVTYRRGSSSSGTGVSSSGSYRRNSSSDRDNSPATYNNSRSTSTPRNSTPSPSFRNSSPSSSPSGSGYRGGSSSGGGGGSYRGGSSSGSGGRR